VTRRLVESVGRVFDPVNSSAVAVFEHAKDELKVTLFAPRKPARCTTGVKPLKPLGGNRRDSA